jgi:hypothetical protein
MINRMTGEPILPARTADQYVARSWFAVCAGKIGSPVRRFIIVSHAYCLRAGWKLWLEVIKKFQQTTQPPGPQSYDVRTY